MPVYKMVDEMPYDEFLGWLNYFERRPYEWRADDRAAKLIQAQGVKEKPWNLFSSLDAIYNSKSEDRQDNALNPSNFKRSGFFQKIAGAIGGETLKL
jgi:hypothetical protein